VLNKLVHSGQSFSTLIPRSPTVGQVTYTVFVWSRVTAPVELSTRYTTADIVLQIRSERLSVE